MKNKDLKLIYDENGTKVYSLIEDDKEYFVMNDIKFRACIYDLQDVVDLDIKK